MVSTNKHSNRFCAELRIILKGLKQQFDNSGPVSVKSNLIRTVKKLIVFYQMPFETALANVASTLALFEPCLTEGVLGTFAALNLVKML